MKEISQAELSQANGQDGRPIYIVHKGRVFDVTQSKIWRKGRHMQRHQAGEDLTTAFQAAPHGEEVFERYPQIGILKQKTEPDRELPGVLTWLLKHFPMLRRHPHPMTVHFPIALILITPFFNVLALLTQNRSFEVTGFHCLGLGIIATIAAISTGLYTWWLNYQARLIRTIKIKISTSCIMLIIAIISWAWRIKSPQILTEWTAQSITYLILILALVPLVAIVGWFGASLTFPVEKE
jgi:predicted heme/steroid binding protein/uncharacterized membrane protein